MLAKSFNAVIDGEISVLVLGSMPGVKSLEQQQYYAHPRNAFWPIMNELLNLNRDLSYAEQLTQLNWQGVGLWDVYGQCYREGSLDASIDQASIEFNPIVDVLSSHPDIKCIACNGQAAYKAMLKYKKQTNKSLWSNVEIKVFPSTSPANAAMNFDEKLACWSVITQYLQ